jgi:cell division protease FtsH
MDKKSIWRYFLIFISFIFFVNIINQTIISPYVRNDIEYVGTVEFLNRSPENIQINSNSLSGISNNKKIAVKYISNEAKSMIIEQLVSRNINFKENFNTIGPIFNLLLSVGTSFMTFMLIKWLFFNNNQAPVNVPFKVNMKEKITFDDVIGYDSQKDEVKQIIELINDNVRAKKFNCKTPKGILLFGPPGNGKTLLAKAVANEVKASFFYVSASSLAELYVGAGSLKLRILFDEARKHAPSVIFIDEIDSLGKRSDFTMSRNSNDSQSIINELLTQLDGFISSNKVSIIIATNDPEAVDKALLRPGRIDRQIEIPNPNKKNRYLIISKLLSEIRLNANKNFISERLSMSTIGMSCAEIVNIINEAKLEAMKDKADVITYDHIERAIDKARLGVVDKNRELRQEDIKTTAYHEAGHAFIMYFFRDILQNKLYKATIESRGRVLGFAAYYSEQEVVSVSKEEMKVKVITTLAGRAVEETFFGDEGVSSGCHSDLEHARRIIEVYVTSGMDVDYGFLNINPYDWRTPEYAKKRIYSTAERILKELYHKTKDIINDNKAKISRVADALLKHTTLTGEEIALVINNKLLVKNLPAVFNVQSSFV